MWKWVAGVALAVGSVMPAEAQEAPKLSFERVFASPDLAGTQPRSMKLSPDGKYLTVLRNRADEKERFDLWAMDTTTGEWRMLVDSKKVGSGAALSEAEKMQMERARIAGTRGIISYDWSPDSKSIVVPLEGEVYLALLDGSVRKLDTSSGPKLNVTMSPMGGHVSYVHSQNLSILDLASGKTVVPTDSNGKDTIHWGEAEFVAQEEMDRFTGHWWAPDDSRIAVQKFDEAPVGIVTRAAIGAETSTIVQQRYPKAGTANVLVELWLMNPDGSGKVRVDLGQETDIYLARVKWSPDAKTLYVQRQNRDQTVLDLLAVDPATGKSRVVFTERSGEKSWVNLSNAFTPLKDGSLIWWSERDGHGHLYRWKKGKFTQLTKGDWEVFSVTGVDEAKGRVYFLANRGDVLERQLYWVDLNRPGTPSQLTQEGWWNMATMDKAASRMIVTRSNTSQPAQVYLADTSGKRLAWVNENSVKDAAHPYNPYLASHRVRTFGTIKAEDGTTLHWEMITPEMEPGKRYPVFFQHYGGPHNQSVSRSWGGALQQSIVDRGYIWFQIDNRGSANRGKVFEDAIYHAMGTVEVTDQLAGAAYLKTLDFVDPDRISTYGWSYGGYMTLKMLEAAPGVFAAGISGAPVSKWELYDTHYTERYMGDPRVVPEAYKASNTVENATKITDPLLLIHGMADDNVVLEHSTVMMATLQANAVPFEVMLYPGHTHKVGGPKVSVHLWNLIFTFLDRSAPAK
ncbi:DPP IV N-terminal domain-containing protein [Sphingomonas sp. G-3-2-10]|uniref:S9 family peptidase n=1 Tax=Sphingomonas sp. G-3-2-10 TaxID=2728838 RepID=UPI00146A9C4F|nr:DPP IV N-terminal domain-containing protein [Sphingomonas sp. G-3-2-10]NML04657.1 prolyl oligopeptidase family serine peptidase [Sphingomonas sp. G-3-2-10]